MKRIILSTVLFLAISIAVAVSYLKFALPNVGKAEDIKIEYSPARIERGAYLANSVAACMDCHSTRDWTLMAGPLVSGTLGCGGEAFTQEFGFPGKFYARNITPYGIGNWTDGELLRAITSGVSKDGKALFPVMPHPNYGQMDKEDIYCIIAYIRSLSPIKKDIEESQADFPMNLIINTIPKKASFSKRPEESNQIAYGKYMFTMASCADCHTKQEKGKAIAGMEMAGGFEFPLPEYGTVRSANITPDKQSGIGNWTETTFVERFKRYQDSAYSPAKIAKGHFQTVMPWMMYSTMKENDLKAIYAYIQTLKPIRNEVEKFSTATP